MKETGYLLSEQEALLREIDIVCPAVLLQPGEPLSSGGGSGELLRLLDPTVWGDAHPKELFGFHKRMPCSFLEGRVSRPGTRIELVEQYGGLIREHPGDVQQYRVFAPVVTYVNTGTANLSFLNGVRFPVRNMLVIGVPPAGGDLLYLSEQRARCTDPEKRKGRPVVPSAYSKRVEQKLTNATTEAIFGLRPHGNISHIFDQFAQENDLAVCAFYLPGYYAQGGRMLETFANVALTRSGFTGTDGEWEKSTGEPLHVRLFLRIDQRTNQGWVPVDDPEWRLNEACIGVWIGASVAARQAAKAGEQQYNADPQILVQMKQLGQW